MMDQHHGEQAIPKVPAELISSGDERFESLSHELREEAHRAVISSLLGSGNTSLVVSYCHEYSISTSDDRFGAMLEPLKNEGRLLSFVEICCATGRAVPRDDYVAMLDAVLDEWESAGGAGYGSKRAVALTKGLEMVIDELEVGHEPLSAHERGSITRAIDAIIGERCDEFYGEAVDAVEKSIRFIWNQLSDTERVKILSDLAILPARVVHEVHLTVPKMIGLLARWQPLLLLASGLRQGVMLEPDLGSSNDGE